MVPSKMAKTAKAATESDTRMRAFGAVPWSRFSNLAQGPIVEPS
jgi:hypothetical protein